MAEWWLHCLEAKVWGPFECQEQDIHYAAQLGGLQKQVCMDTSVSGKNSVLKFHSTVRRLRSSAFISDKLCRPPGYYLAFRLRPLKCRGHGAATEAVVDEIWQA